jgi:integrase/recombinase XerD
VHINKHRLWRLYNYRAERQQEKVRGKDRVVSTATLNRETALLRHIISMAVKWEILDVNPLLRVEMLKEEPRQKILPLSLLREMIDRCQMPGKHSEATLRLKHFIVIALNSGMRKNEILRLTWDRVNFDTRYISLIKTKSKPRPVWMNDALLDLIQRLHGPGERRSGYVFPNDKQDGPQKDIKQAWSGLMKRIGIEDFRIHDLRRCWSTYVKGDLVSRQQGMGHSSIMMTAAYTVPLEEELKKMYASFQMWENENKVIEFPDRLIK